MGFSVKDYAATRRRNNVATATEQENKKREEQPVRETGGFSVRDYATRRLLESGGAQSRYNEYSAFLNRINDYGNALAREAKTRDGVYQNSSDFASYYSAKSGEMDELLKQAFDYRDYFQRYGDLYGESYAPTLENVNGIIQYLGSAKKGLLDENQYWRGFKDEDDYNRQKTIYNMQRGRAADTEIGQYGKGNIDLYNRPQYRNEDGSVSTVRSAGFSIDGQEVLLPTVAFDADGNAISLTDNEALERYRQTGEYLGRFDTREEADKYAELLHQAQDWYYGSRYRSTANGQEKFNAWNGTYSNTGFDDITYDYINRDENAIDRQRLTDIQSNASLLGLDNGFLQRMTDDEIAIFNYLYANVGSEAAYDYISNITGDLTYRQRMADTEAWAQYAQEHPVGSSAFSVLESPLKGLSYIGQAADYLGTGSIDQNAGYNKFSYINSAIRGTVAQEIKNSGKWGGVGSFAYQTGMSMADFLFNTAISGGNEAVVLAIMGSGAAADTVMSAKDRGLSDGQTFMLGTIAGAAEIVTEKISLETLLNPELLADGSLQYILKNIVAEGSEEVGSDIINLVADVLISKDQSEWRQSISDYMAQGYSESEATGLAVRDQALNMGLDFLGGAISGGVMAGVGAGSNNLSNFINGRQFNGMGQDVVESIVQEGLDSDPSTRAYRGAQQLRTILDYGQPIGNLQLGAQYQNNVRAIEAENAANAMIAEAQRIGTVSNRQANDLLGNDYALSLLREQAGLTLTDDMSKSQRRAAVKNAVLGFARASTAQERAGATSDTAQAATRTAANAEPHSAANIASRQVQRAAATLGTNGARAFMAAYDADTQQSVSAADAFSSFARVYNAALNGQNIEAAKANVGGKIPSHMILAAESAGEQDARRSAQAAYFGKDAGLVQDAAFRKSKISGKDARLLDGLAKAAGIQIRVAPSVTGTDAKGEKFSANASYENGALTVALDSDDPLWTATIHELVHRVRETSLEAYQKLARFVQENMSDERLSSAERERAARYRSTDISEVTEEMVADAFGYVLGDQEAVEKLVRDDRSTAQKILDALRDLIDRIRAALRGDSGAQLTQEQRATFQELQGKAEEMAQMLTDALDSIAPERQAERSAAPDTGATQYSINRRFASDIQDWRDDGMPADERFILGETSDVLQGLGAIENDIYMNGDKIKQILNDHSEMTLDTIKRIPEMLDDPVLILKSRNYGRGGKANTRLVVFGTVKADNGSPVMAVLDLRPIENHLVVADMQRLTSAYTKDKPTNFLTASEVLHADKKRTAPLLRSMGFYMPIDLLRNGSIGSITYSGTDVNIEGLPFSSVVRLGDAGENATQNDGNSNTKFSLKQPVEQTEDLIALHNLNADKLDKVLALGGFPMPSIAVTKASIPHTNFGDITLVMDKSAIDPKADRRNTVYSADAWTPTFPPTEYEVNEKVASKMRKKYYELSDRFGYDTTRAMYPYVNYADDEMNKIGGERGIMERESNNIDMMKLYLMDKGVELPAPVTETKTEHLPDDTIRLYDHFVDTLGEDVIREITPKDGASPMQTRKDWYTAHGDAFEAAYREFMIGLGIDEETVNHVLENETISALTRHIVGARNYLNHGAEKTTTVTNVAATNEAIRAAVDPNEYRTWLDELFGGIEKSSGIYNGKERYTPSGNTRSFAATHFPVTLENIARAMAAQNNGNSRNVSGFYGVKSLRAGTAAKFSSIAEMHQLEGRLQHLTEEEAEQISDALSERMTDIMQRILDTKPKSAYDNSFIDMDHIGEIFMEIAEKRPITAESVVRAFNGTAYKVSNEIAGDVRDLLFDVSQMPVNIYEAKPERAVRFNEVLAAVVPQGTDAELVRRLRDAGVQNIMEYEEGNDADRLEKVNSVEGAKFSRKADRDAARREADLMRENDTLRAQVDYWKAQTKRSNPSGAVEAKAVNKTANELIDYYGSTLKAADITSDLQRLYDLMGTGKNEDGELSYEAARELASGIAEQIAENAIDDSESLYGTYRELRDFLRQTEIIVTPEESHEIADWGEWRKSQMGRLNIKRGETSTLDRVYDELSFRWPEFFPGDVMSAGDQIQRIADVLDSVYNDRGFNPYDPYMEQAVIDIGNDIMERFFDLPQVKTFADKQAAKIETMRIKLSEMRRANSERLQDSLSKVRENRDQRLADLAEKYKAKTAEGRERQSAATLRKKINRHTAALSQKLLRPTDKQHIPDALRAPVAAMLEAINKESAYDYEASAYLGEKAQRVPRGEGNITTKRTQAFEALKKQYSEIARGDEMVIDPALLSDQNVGFEGLFDQVIAMSDTPIQRMNTEQLQTIWQVVRAVEHSVSTYNKTLSAAKFKATSDWAQRFLLDTRTRRDRSSIMGQDFALDMENPYTFFSQYGDAGMAIYRMLRDAQDTQRLRLDQIVDAVHEIADAKTVKDLRAERHTFQTRRGQDLTLTTGQVMELYNLAKRGQAQDHLLKGGIVKPEIKADMRRKLHKIERGSETIRLTAEDLANITGALTPEQMRIADALQQLTAGKLADWGNEASVKAYGYRKFTGTDYWPIHSAREVLHSSVEKDSGNARSIKNIGLAKAVIPHANNAVSVQDVFDTFAEHAADMIDYATWLLPMEDANRLFNYQYRDADGLPTTTFKAQLDRVGGKNGKAQRYWQNLMSDIQNGIGKGGETDIERTVSRIVGNTKGASVGANLRVVAQQPTAFLRANAVMNPASLTKGLIGGVTRGNGWEKAQRYAPIARIKDVGGFDQSATRSVSSELYGDATPLQKVSDAAGWAAGKADAITWGKLWNASEWETRRLYPDLATGSAAFYEKAAEIFTDMIDQTQVVDGILQRSAVMRSENGLTQQATAFMGEPIMSLNLLLRAYDGVRYENDAEKRGTAIKLLGRSVLALAITDTVNAVVQSFIDAYRDDDKDKDYWERLASALTGLTGDEEKLGDYIKAMYLNGNLLDNMSLAGRIPYVKDVRSMLQGFTVERLDASTISDLIQAHNRLTSGKVTKGYGYYKLLGTAAKILGIPAVNLERDALGIVRSIVYATGDTMAAYQLEKLIYNNGANSNKGRFYDIMYKALEQGDYDAFDRMRDDLMEAQGGSVSGKDIDSAMKSRYNDAVKGDPSYSLPQESADRLGLRRKYGGGSSSDGEEKFSAENLNSAQYGRYVNKRTTTYRELERSVSATPEFKALSGEDKDRALTWAYTLASDMALEDSSNGQYQITTKWETYAKDAQTYGISLDTYLLFHVVEQTTKGDKDEDGKDIKGQKKADKLRDWLEEKAGLTDGQREFLWNTVYASEW